MPKQVNVRAHTQTRNGRLVQVKAGTRSAGNKLTPVKAPSLPKLPVPPVAPGAKSSGPPAAATPAPGAVPTRAQVGNKVAEDAAKADADLAQESLANANADPRATKGDRMAAKAGVSAAKGEKWFADARRKSLKANKSGDASDHLAANRAANGGWKVAANLKQRQTQDEMLYLRLHHMAAHMVAAGRVNRAIDDNTHKVTFSAEGISMGALEAILALTPVKGHLSYNHGKIVFVREYDRDQATDFKSADEARKENVTEDMNARERINQQKRLARLVTVAKRASDKANDTGNMTHHQTALRHLDTAYRQAFSMWGKPGAMKTSDELTKLIAHHHTAVEQIKAKRSRDAWNTRKAKSASGSTPLSNLAAQTERLYSRPE